MDETTEHPGGGPEFANEVGAGLVGEPLADAAEYFGQLIGVDPGQRDQGERAKPRR